MNEGTQDATGSDSRSATGEVNPSDASSDVDSLSDGEAGSKAEEETKREEKFEGMAPAETGFDWLGDRPHKVISNRETWSSAESGECQDGLGGDGSQDGTGGGNSDKSDFDWIEFEEDRDIHHGVVNADSGISVDDLQFEHQTGSRSQLGDSFDRSNLTWVDTTESESAGDDTSTEPVESVTSPSSPEPIGDAPIEWNDESDRESGQSAEPGQLDIDDPVDVEWVDSIEIGRQLSITRSKTLDAIDATEIDWDEVADRVGSTETKTERRYQTAVDGLGSSPGGVTQERTDSNTEIDSDRETDPDIDSVADTETDPDIGSVADSETATDTEHGPVTDSETATDTEHGPVTDSEAEHGLDSSDTDSSAGYESSATDVTEKGIHERDPTSADEPPPGGTTRTVSDTNLGSESPQHTEESSGIGSTTRRRHRDEPTPSKRDSGSQAATPTNLAGTVDGQIEPGSTVLVKCPTRDERKPEVCNELLNVEGFERPSIAEPTGKDGNRNVLLVSFERLADDHLDRIERTANEVKVLTVGYSDNRRSRDGVTFVPITDPADVTRLGIILTKTIGDWEREDGTVLLCFDSLSIHLQYVREQQLFQFLHILLSKLRNSSVESHFHMDPTAHEQHVVVTFEQLFDVVVDVDKHVHVER